MGQLWKEKIVSKLQEWRKKLPYASDPMKQYAFLLLGGSTLIVACVIIVALTPPHSHNTVASQPNGTLPNSSSGSQNANQANQYSNTHSSAVTQSVNTSTGQLPIRHSAQPGQSESQTVLPPTTNRTTNGNSQSAGSSSIVSTSGQVGTITQDSVIQNGSTTQNYQDDANLLASTSPGNSPSPTQSQTQNTDIQNIPIYFQGPGGTLQQYIAPTAPPINVTWSTYFNEHDRYVIDIPNGWQVVHTLYNSHEGLSIYPPGMDPTLTLEEGLKVIGLGVSQYAYQVPYLDNSQVSYQVPITIDGYSGKLYTEGLYQQNTIVTIINYSSVYFGLSSTANSDDMIYIFLHMLSSLQFIGI